MRILIVGAGRIGRGLLGQLFASAGWSVVFVERSEPLAGELRQRGSYTVHLAGEEGLVGQTVVSDFTVLAAGSSDAVAEEVGRADLLAVAVQPPDLASAAGLLAPGLRRRLLERPAGLNLILCANASGAASDLRRGLERAWGGSDRGALKKLGILETIVIRAIPDPPAELRAENPLDLLANDCRELYLDRDAVVGTLPVVPGLVPQDRFAARGLRKLYTYNLIHVLLGFWGQAEGYDAVTDCFRDPWIRRQAESALEEATAGLSGELGFSAEEMSEWNEGVRRLMSNPHIADRVGRLVRDPLRKLARDERLTGAALLALKHGKQPRALARVIAYVLHSQGMGAEQAKQACQLEPEDAELERLIGRAWRWIAREKEASALGFEFERTFKGCGQCTFAAVQQALGREEERAFQALTAFAGGFGLSGDAVCGALIGGGACFGLARGRRRGHFDGDREPKYSTFAMAQRLRERYLWKYGSLLCRGAQERIFGRSFDLRSPQDREQFERAGAHVDKCPQVVGDVARWSVQIMAEEAAEEEEAAQAAPG
jgi:mannitol-1-phosphate 5-dehydrogenase